ncbi:MAG: hypothetical protein GWP05_01300 [Anaerolineaceae bacterium]|nr:hypothetical protein [Anaerolineaceae bacterium]
MARCSLSLVVLVLLGSGCVPAPEKRSDILLGPYVNSVSTSNAKVLWVPRPGVNTEAKLLLDKGQAASEATVASRTTPIAGRREQVHELGLTGLEAGKTYRYVVRAGQERVEGEFTTAPPPGSRQPFRFAVYGDTRSLPERHRKVIEGMAGDLPFAFLVNSGDLVANGTVWRHWQRDFFGPARRLLNRTALWPVRGNHEGDALLYRDLFDLPNNELYYSFDYGNLHFVVLDSNLDGPDAVGNPPDPEMLAWLRRDLAATQAEWIIVSYHEPTFNIGGHASTWGQRDLLGILEKYGVDMVLSGHSHIYERFLPIGPRGGKPVIFVVTGGGGAPTYDLRPSPILARSSRELHYCLFEIEGNTLKMTVKTPGGKVLDEMTLVKSGQWALDVRSDGSPPAEAGAEARGFERLELVRSNGRYQDEVMRQAVATQDAIDLAFIASTGLSGDFSETPKPGAVTQVTIEPFHPLAKEAKIRFTTVTDSPWRVEPAHFLAKDAPFKLQVRAPENLVVTEGAIDPPLKVNFTVTYRGLVYPGDNRLVHLSKDTIRRLTPPPKPADVPYAADPIVIDGRLDDWKGIGPLVLPATRSASRITRLAWRKDGLYAALEVRDKKIEINPGASWTADGLELFIEGDHARSFDARKNASAMKCVVYPLPNNGGGKAGVEMSYGRYKTRPQIITAAWRKSIGGYTLELFIPAEVLAPAVMAPGTQMGFYYLLRDGGRTVEEFSDTRGKRAVWRTALYWGAVRLVESR